MDKDNRSGGVDASALSGLTPQSSFRETMDKLMRYLGVDDQPLWDNTGEGKRALAYLIRSLSTLEENVHNHRANIAENIVPFPRTIRGFVENAETLRRQHDNSLGDGHFTEHMRHANNPRRPHRTHPRPSAPPFMHVYANVKNTQAEICQQKYEHSLK